MKAEFLARQVKLMVLDVDGVLTDGGLYYDHNGQVMKRFHVQDGLGIKMAASVGLQFAVITGLDSQAVQQRVTELGIAHYFPGCRRKAPIMRELAQTTGISLTDMAYIGDDWIDAAPMSMVGFPVAVANARPEIVQLAAWTTKSMGGQGAAREVIDFVLRAQGKFEVLWQNWLEK